MPDIVRVRNITGDELSVGLLGRSVEADCVADFAGKVTEEGDDCYLIESGQPPAVHAWPKAMWSLESGFQPTASPARAKAKIEGKVE